MDGIEVNDQTWFKLMLPTFIWFVFLLAVAVMNITSMGYLGYATILLFCSSGFIVYSIIKKDLTTYKIGFWIYCSYTGVCIVYDALTILFIWFFFDIYLMMVGGVFKIAEAAGAKDDATDTAQQIVGFALFGMKCLCTLAFVISILVDLCFLCHLRGRIKIFIKYNEGKQGTTDPQLLAS
jgi:hypothetical protein